MAEGNALSPYPVMTAGLVEQEDRHQNQNPFLDLCKLCYIHWDSKVVHHDIHYPPSNLRLGRMCKFQMWVGWQGIGLVVFELMLK